jgi:hypothetical protein
MAPRKPIVGYTTPQSPLVDDQGRITWTWTKWFQGIQQALSQIPLDSGSVSSVSVAAANGFAGSVTNPTTTPNIAIRVDDSHYLPTTTDEANWNAKQPALTLPLAVAQGGTGTTTPSLVPGTNVTITGAWPNQTVNSTGGSGSGTVSSVALSAPTEFTVSGSPVTTSGTLTFAKANQSANLVYAGPSTGSAAAPTFRAVVSADVPLLNVGFVINNGVTGTNVGPELFARAAGSFTKCAVVTKTSNASTVLTFKIKKNGTNVFSVDPTVAAGTSGGTLSTFTTLTSSPLPVAANDIFTIDITSGASDWAFTAVLE